MPNAKYKIAFVTGKRGGFDAMLPTLKAMREHDRLEPLVIACDQHNMPYMGNTIHHIICEWGIPETVTSHTHDLNSPFGRMISISEQMGALAWYFDNIKPDCVLLIGDRAESVVAALVAHNMRIPIAHVQGGDRTGGVDERQRSAITELSDLHLCSNQHAYMNLYARQVRGYIHTVGDPHIDPIALGNFAAEDELKEQGYPTDPAIIVLQHPDTLDDIEVSWDQMEQTFNACANFIQPKIAIYPSSDQGHLGIVKAIKTRDQLSENVYVYQNIPQYYFLALLKRAACIVGNSSAGIIEAACFGTRAIDIGSRQLGRLRGDNVRWSAHDSGEIKTWMEWAINGRDKPTWLYGDGKAYTRIPQIILEFLDA